MRVIITGGTGLIGSALANNLAADGHEAIVLSRSPGDRDQYGLRPNVRIEQWDSRTAEGWGELADGADAIVNLAGANLAAGRWTDDRKRIIRSSRINAGRAVVAAVDAANHKPGVLIQASGINYYGPRGDEVVSEDDGPGDDFLARTCIDWEASTEPVEKMGVRRVITRSGVVLSNHGGALPRLVTPARLFVGGPLGSGDQWFPWVHLADEVSAIRFFIANESASGPYNLSAPQPTTNREFIKTLGHVLNRPTVMRVPTLALKLLFGEMAVTLLEGQRVVPTRLINEGYTFRFPDAEAALQDLLK